MLEPQHIKPTGRTSLAEGQNPYWVSIFTFCRLAYIFSGCVGAAILAKIWPTLLSGYALADDSMKEIYRIIFTNSTEMVYGGIWGYLLWQHSPAKFSTLKASRW